MLTSRIIGGVCITAAAVFFAAAAVGKFLDVAEFHRGLDGWDLLPEDARPFLAVAVPSAELLVSGLWLLGLSRRVSPLVMLGLLFFMTGVYLAHVVFAEPPRCNCLGELAAFRLGMDSARGVVVRNAVLMALLGVGILLRHPKACSVIRTRGSKQWRSPTISGGFTLIETILTVALIGLLVVLAMPSLASVRTSARDVRALSDLRQHALTFNMYAGDFDEHLPFFADPRATETVIRFSGGAVSFHYFSSSTFWPYALVDSYYDGIGLWSDIFRSPFARGGEVGDTLYVYSCTLIAAPAYWDLSTRMGRQQFVPNRVSDVRYPSQKVLLSADPWTATSDNRVGFEHHDLARERVLLASVAGDARKVRNDGLGPTVRSGDGGYGLDVDWRHRVGWLPSGAHTLHGSLGRDLP